MENWGAIIYDYKRGMYSPAEALKIVNSRIAKSTRGSVAIRTLRGFRDELLRDHPEIRKVGNDAE